MYPKISINAPDASSYRGWALAPGPHWETILPNLSRRRLRVAYRRRRLELSDGDFVDIDLAGEGVDAAGQRCLLVLHGLEGDSRAPYVKSFVRAALRRGYAVAAMNMRGCSGELNRLPRFYHSGETGDPRQAIGWLGERFKSVAVVGFSLGGNVALKLLGEEDRSGKSGAAAAVAISAPVDLVGSSARLSEEGNRLYMRRFIRLLSRKIEAKARVYPEVIDASGVRRLQSFAEFDGRYTAPLNGFASALDYWSRCSALPLLGRIQKPALLLNARNDPFLSESCFPSAPDVPMGAVVACYPERGGHLGFPGRRVNGACWHERVALDFLDTVWR